MRVITMVLGQILIGTEFSESLDLDPDPWLIIQLKNQKSKDKKTSFFNFFKGKNNNYL